MFFKQLLHLSLVRFSLIAVILSFGLLSGSQFADQVEAAPSTLPSSLVSNAMSSAPGDVKGHICTVVNIYTDSQKIDVNCLPFDGPYGYFTMSTSDSKFAARVYSTLLVARSAGIQIGVLYDTADAGLCANPNNCRNILAIELK